VVWFGVRLSISGEMSVGQLISFVLYSTLLVPLLGIAELYAQIKKQWSQTCFLLRKLSKINSEQNTGQIENKKCTSGFSATFPKKEIKVLKDVNFTANLGKNCYC
jgi:ABC-type bacteriocin/lantibiotic exporter with double-glycine peptidase domain